MGFQEFIQRYHKTGYKKLTLGSRLKKTNRRFKGFRLITSRRKLKWRSFWMALTVPKRRMLQICCDMMNRLKVDDAYPAIVFSCQWGLPVLSHPASSSSSRCRNPNVSFYRKPANINHVVVA
ncbi:hypothetical protein L6452_22483 [Arctium lappa]|uniref:Uncharacterized protein n=1 Tax=Arctium lappa TaxID=4217 RepID=A0ACB9AZ29_ARCLA|nr:hypothetical protein L6452_22483 [Arctium lappa]